MTKQAEVMAEVGKVVAKEAAKQIASELKGGELTGYQKELNDLINEVAARQTSVTLQIFRIDPLGGQKYVTDLKNIPPELLSNLHPTVKAWCGGGTYRVKILADGIKERTLPLEIEGEPLPPVNERRRDIPANAFSVTPSGQIAAGPGFASFLGLAPAGVQSPVVDSTANKAMGAMESITAMLLAKTLGNDNDPRARQESDELRALREMVADLKRDKEIAAADARHQREMAELNAKLEKLAKPAQEDTITKVLAVLATALPAALQAKAMSDQAQAQAKAAADQAQMQFLGAMIAAAKPDNTAQAELLKAALSKPDQSDQMLKVYEAMGGMMATSVQLTQGIINQMASLQGGEQRPWWQEAALQLASAIGDIAQAAMSKSEVVKADKAEVRRLGPHDEHDIDAAAQAAAAAERQLEQHDDPQEQEDQEEGFAGPSRKDPRFLDSFFERLFSLIEGTAPAEEIAFRLWKHASSGNQEALDWIRDPRSRTEQTIIGFLQRREMEITEERFNEVVSAIVDLHEHFRAGGTAEAYVAHYKLKIDLPRRVAVVPVERDPDAEPEADDTAPAAGPQPVEPGHVAPPPAPEVVPTPGLDRVPPPPRRAHPSGIGPERIASPSPMGSAAEQIPTEPRS
jgi:hypothetical protein